MQQWTRNIGHISGDHLQLAVGLGELQGGLHFIALPDSLFFVGRDALCALGGDVLDAIEVLYLVGAGQRRAARHAAIGIALQPEVPIAAGRAEAGYISGQPCALSHLVLPGDGEQGLDDPVLAAFVIDETVWTELAEREKSRARQETLSTDVAAACRDIGQQRQAREVVPRQKALAGQVAVGVEVAVERTVTGQQQISLFACLVVALLGLAPLALAGSGVVLDLEVELDGPSGGKVQIAPTLERVVEFSIRALEG